MRTWGFRSKGSELGDRFLEALAGESDPETKRKAIGKVFVDVFDDASKEVEGAHWLAQGTIYPDVIESVSATGGPSATIKSHHNVGGLPDLHEVESCRTAAAVVQRRSASSGQRNRAEAIDLGSASFPRAGSGDSHLGRYHQPKRFASYRRWITFGFKGLKEAICMTRFGRQVQFYCRCKVSVSWGMNARMSKPLP